MTKPPSVVSAELALQAGKATKRQLRVLVSWAKREQSRLLRIYEMVK